ISGCRSTSACMVVQPTTRQGLLTPALEKQMVHGASVMCSVVSTKVGSMACIQIWSAGPSGVAVMAARWKASCSASKNSEAWLKATVMPMSAKMARIRLADFTVLPPLCYLQVLGAGPAGSEPGARRVRLSLDDRLHLLFLTSASGPP